MEGLIREPGENSFAKKLPKFQVSGFTVEPLQYITASPWARTSGADYLAKTELDLGETSTVNPPAVYEEVDSLITCFRLFKPGYVGASLVVGEAWASVNKKNPITFFFGSSPRSAGGGMAYGLGLKEVPLFVEFAEKIAPLISSGPHISLRNPAFRFFNRGIEDMARSDWSFSVIDFVSCLEALLSPSHFELAHRLSEAVTLVSERDASNRKKRYDEVKDLYDKRSKAVHGAMVKLSPDDATLAENLARETLRFCLGYYSKGYGKREILEDINNLILGRIKEFPDYAFEYTK